MIRLFVPLLVLGAFALGITQVGAQNVSSAQPSVAATTEAAYGSVEWLSKRCLEFFDNKKYRGIFDNEYGKRVISYTFATTGEVIASYGGGTPYCPVTYTFLADNKSESGSGSVHFRGYLASGVFKDRPGAWWRLYLRADGSFLLMSRNINPQGMLRDFETILSPVAN